MVRRKIIWCLLGIMCFANVSSTNKCDFDKINNVMVRNLGPDTAQIILSADSIVAHLIVWEKDTLPCKTLSLCESAIVKYTMCQPVMYLKDKRMYSGFYADVKLVFIKENTFITLELDYNINKWRLIDENGEQKCRHDLRNVELLTLFRELWPESENIKIKYDEFTE